MAVRADRAKVFLGVNLVSLVKRRDVDQVVNVYVVDADFSVCGLEVKTADGAVVAELGEAGLPGLGVPFVSIDEHLLDRFDWVRENLKKGRINLCLAVDLIDDDLRRLIEHLNLVSVSDVSVTALQLRYARHGDLEILIPTSFGAELAKSTNPKPKQDRWTWAEFTESLTSADDRAFAEEIVTRVENFEKAGKHGPLWFGTKPGGGVFVHISSQRYAPFQFWRSGSGELRVFGNWTSWPNLKNDERFAALAELLGQTHEAGMKSFPVSKLDIEKFWEVSVACDLAINE